MNTRSLILSVLIAGVVMALLGNLPVVNLVNCILCLWVWLGGALAVVLYRGFQRGQPAATPGQGAGLGALSGLVGAVLGAGAFILASPLTTPVMNEVARALNIQGSPLMGGGPGTPTVAQASIFLVIDVVLYPIFGALGGLITASVTRRPAAPPHAP
jgi:hypothetical protein